MTDAAAGPPQPIRKKILIVADKSEECRVALRFAGLRALHTGGRLSLLYVIEPADFQHWVAVENIMRAEAREEAESLLHSLAAEVNRATGLVPEFLIREGAKREELMRQLEEDPSIRLLVLGAGLGKEGPGPLVSLIAGEVAGTFPVPVTIVPGNMTADEVGELA